jgi:TRAP-type mannitol/chloroaromatic compound transport system substrate-binding protein
VSLQRYPIELMRAAQKAAFEFYDEEAAKNAAFRKIFVSWRKFREDAQTWSGVAEQAYDSFASANKL